MLEKLKERLAKEEENLKNSSGKVCMFSETGPISLGLFKALVDVVEQQAKEIEELKKRPS